MAFADFFLSKGGAISEMGDYFTAVNYLLL